jgi:crotonobetainyl-CoA:carnitine CoA-transferase CaiB-like acyl-CoA transferase
MQRPLEGIHVLDLSIWQHGTYATAMLADLGADVIKVEEPESGDPGRYFWMSPEGLSAYFEAHNRGKRSLAIDLRDQRGRDVFLRLVQTADVFLNNFRTGAIRRLRLRYEDLAEVNPRLVYVQASGNGHRGNEEDAGSFDLLAQARGGLMSVTGEPDDPPLPAGVPIADQVGGMQACIAVLAGLAGRNATGRGMKFDTSLLGTQVALQSFNITNYLFTRRLPQRRERGGATPFWRAYRGGDGKWFVIGMLLDRAWGATARAIGRPDLLEDERFDAYRKRHTDHARELIAILDETFASDTAAAWVQRLNAAGMFAAPVQDYAEVAQDEQVLANQYIHEVPRDGGDPLRMAGIGMCLDGEPVTIERLAPQLGEHTEDVLCEAGFTWDEVTRLREQGIVGPRRGPQAGS